LAVIGLRHASRAEHCKAGSSNSAEFLASGGVAVYFNRMGPRVALLVLALLATGCHYKAKFRPVSCATGEFAVERSPWMCKNDARIQSDSVVMQPDGSCRVCSK
jgi:hypothetical protein